MTPELLPMLKPFAEAVAFQRERIGMTRDEFDALSNEAKLRAFTIAGLTKKSLIESAQFEAMQAISDGVTKSEFLDRLSNILDAQGGVFLSPRRLELIAQNNMATAYAAGRHRQMSDPDVIADRPYRQYPLGPSDSRTSEICRKLEGLVARYDDPIWNHITPPNHHNERHIKVLTLTQEQAQQSGKMYGSPADLEYPVIEGQTILPDPGFDYQPGLVTADDRALVEAANAVGDVLPAKSAADYGLGRLDELSAEELPAMPRLLPRADDGDVDAAWQRFRAHFGIDEDATGTIINDVFGDGVRVNRVLSDKLARENRAHFASLITPTVEDPIEVWLVARTRADETVYHKRYIALFNEGERKKPFFAVADESPEGWVMRTAFRNDDWDHLERQRQGRLLLRKGRRG